VTEDVDVAGDATETGVAKRRRRRVRTVDVVGLDHVQLAMPKGEEALARLFYGGVMGLQEVKKPRELHHRGGAWFVGPGGVAVHLGVMDPFKPSVKAHAAFRVASLERARNRLATHRVDVIEDDSGSTVRRVYIHDPFGNRLELIDARDSLVRGGGGERRGGGDRRG
jgi:catechol 2,3-dioxygenase-like lactoylglutathione lyase family enzyme